MRIIRTLLFAAFGLIALIFIGLNWRERVPVRIWPFDEGLLFEWPVGFIAPVFFLLGFLPMWFYHRGVKWSLSRKVVSLENAARTNVAPKPAAPSPSPPPPPQAESDVLKPESEA
ncbi:LapA family protein [Erythrobacter sp. SDW2]|uniref:LapA family protein n=1 Tax=Erythrobacter sp. SDW2 TaxID=2907154 RepID=UPI001F2A37A8|nr:LapA family protein [Erythrobacter sp. SDW2]UIP05513.1 LapA family protein [Erythrobacter sp. SDW2]